jgi:hypothetical protein
MKKARQVIIGEGRKNGKGKKNWVRGELVCEEDDTGKVVNMAKAQIAFRNKGGTRLYLVTYGMGTDGGTVWYRTPRGCRNPRPFTQKDRKLVGDNHGIIVDACNALPVNI